MGVHADEASEPAPAQGAHGVLAAAGGVAGLTLLSRALGFLRWVVQATTVGAGTVAGAYATANQVPNVLYEVVVGGALAATIVPLLASAIASGRSQETSRTASGLLGVVLVVLVPLGALLALLAEPVAGAFPVSQGTDAALQHALVVSFLRMFALQVPLYGVGVVLTGVLQAHGRFTWPAITPVLSSLVVMATYALYGMMSRGEGGGTQAAGATDAALQVLGWGTTLGVAALSLPLLWPVSRLGVRLRPSLRLETTTASRALRLGGAGLVTLVAQQASVLVVLALARSGGQSGTAAVYQYTQAVYVLPYAVLVVPVATVVYPRLSAAFQEGTRSRAAILSATSTALVLAVATAGAGALLAASHGAQRFFSLLTDVQGMGLSLALLAPALLGYSVIYQVTRVLFAADRARPAALATATGWLVVALASWGAVHVMAPRGGDGEATLVALALGLSAGMLVAGSLLLTVLARRLGHAVLLPTLRVLVVAVPVSTAVGLGSRVLSSRLAGTWTEIAVALLGAVLTVTLTLLAAHLADRSLLRSLRPAPAPAQRVPTEEP